MALTSDDVNYLIQRYMQESGFIHTAFSFGNESFVNKVDVDSDAIQPGALIRLIQKGLQYMELEANLTEDGQRIDGSFSMLPAMDILRAKDADELRQLVRGQKEDAEEESDPEKAPDGDDATAMDVDLAPTVIPAADVRTLAGHEGEVFAVAWSPTGKQLVSTSGDSTGRIWDVGAEGDPTSSVLRHLSGRDDPQKDVTTTDWSPDGLYLATGAYDGIARIWGNDGSLQKTLVGHQGPLFSLKYSKNGSMLLSGSVDKTVIVWDAKTGTIKQHLKQHEGAVLDVSWRTNTSFATCSTDQTIHIYRLDKDQPMRRLTGHRGEVNCINWAPNAKLLASCSDDCTAKLWNLTSDTAILSLKDASLGKLSSLAHELEIYSCRFRPAGPGSENPNEALMLATASFDHKVKLWNAETGALLNTLSQHKKAVYTLNWSPDAKLLATGAFDKKVLIWDANTAQVVKSYDSSGGIFEVTWNPDGRSLAAATVDQKVHVIDLRK